MDDRTAFQRQADTDLEEAIKNVLRAYHDVDNEFLLTEYVVLTTNIKIDDDGHQITSYARAYRDNNMPYHQILGLLDVHRTLVKSHLLEE